MKPTTIWIDVADPDFLFIFPSKPQLSTAWLHVTHSFPEFLTFVRELGHAVQFSQSRGSILLFIINQQVHLRLRQELSHSPSASAGSFLGGRWQRLAVLVFVLYDRREDGRRPGETSLHGVIHSVEPGPGARVCLHASSRKLQFLVETENSTDRPQRDLIVLLTPPPAPAPVMYNSQGHHCSTPSFHRTLCSHFHLKRTSLNQRVMAGTFGHVLWSDEGS